MVFSKLDYLKERLELYREAERKILNSQAYTLGSKQLTRADREDVQKQIRELEGQIEALEERGTTKRRVARAVPLD